MDPAVINCMKADWEELVRSKLSEGLEVVDLLNCSLTQENITLCESLAESYGMIFKENVVGCSGHFFRKNTPS